MATMLSPLNFVDVIEGANLVKVSHNYTNLTRVAKKYRLTKHCDAVLFVNNAYNRYRIVAMFYKVPVLILPPVDPDDLISIYLKISQFLQNFRVSQMVRDFLKQEYDDAVDRVEVRRKRLAKSAKRKVA